MQTNADTIPEGWDDNQNNQHDQRYEDTSPDACLFCDEYFDQIDYEDHGHNTKWNDDVAHALRNELH